MKNTLLKLASAAALALSAALASCGGSTDTNVPVASVRLDSQTMAITMGTAARSLTAIIVPANASNQSVTWTSAPAGIVNVSASGLAASVAPVAAGEAEITVTTQDGNIVGRCAVVVLPNVPVASVALDRQTLVLSAGSKSELTATVLPGDATAGGVTWSNSNAQAVRLTGAGLGPVTIDALAPGGSTITVRSTSDPTKYATCGVIVVVPVAAVALDANALTMVVGEEIMLTATVLPTNATNQNLAWTNGTTTVASMTGSGNTRTIRGLATGTSRITVTTADGGKTDSCLVTVSPPAPVSGVTVAPDTVTVGAGRATTLTATVLPANARDKNVTWSTAAAGTATVDRTGTATARVTGVAPGTTTITVRSNDDPTISATCAVTVTAAVPDDVYLAGDFGVIRNGAVLSGYNAVLYDVYVDDQDVIHACGYSGADAVYYRNAIRFVLPRSAGSEGAVARRLCVSGTNVYCAGYELLSGGGRTVKAWTNGAETSVWVSSDTTFSLANGVTAYGNGIFLSGYYENAARRTAALWQLGTTTNIYFTGGSYAGNHGQQVASDGTYMYLALAGELSRVSLLSALPSATPVSGFTGVNLSVCTNLSDVYTCGYVSSASYTPAYWLNGTRTDLPWDTATGALRSEAGSIFVTPGGTIYTAGRDFHDAAGNDCRPVLWRNGARQTVPGFAGRTGTAWTVFVK